MISDRGVRRLLRVAVALLLASLTTFAAAAGILVRDIGAGFSMGVNGSLLPRAQFSDLIYMYELTYEVAVFSTVRVETVVEASYGNWRATFESNGSFVGPVHPELPGVHMVTVRNLENVTGQVGYSLLQQPSLPPEVEASILNPLLYATLALVTSSAGLFVARTRLGRQDGG